MDKTKRPVNFQEHLEWLALRHQSVDIIFRAENGARTVLRDRITGLFERAGEDFLRTASGMEISVSSLIEAGGMSPDTAS